MKRVLKRFGLRWPCRGAYFDTTGHRGCLTRSEVWAFTGAGAAEVRQRLGWHRPLGATTILCPDCAALTRQCRAIEVST